MEEDGEEEEGWWDSVWSATLAGTLVVVFFPWSLLVMIGIYGWDGTIIILKALLAEALGIVGVLFVLAMIILAVLLFSARPV